MTSRAVFWRKMVEMDLMTQERLIMTITISPPRKKRCKKKKVIEDKGQKEFSRRRMTR